MPILNPTQQSVPRERTLAAQIGQTSGNDAQLKAAFPWVVLADELLISLGFQPGEHVRFSANYVNQSLTISPDHNYRINGRPMTMEEIANREADYATRSKRR